MFRTVLLGAFLVGTGVVAGVLIASRDAPEALEAVPAVRSPAGFRAGQVEPEGRRWRGQSERRLDVLAARIEREAAERRRLQERLDDLTEELAALRPAARGGTEASSAGAVADPGAAAPPAASRPTDAERGDAPEQAAVDNGLTAEQRALIAAGVDPATAAEIKRRRDELTLADMYLRDQATREQWVDTPRFAQEMAELERQRVSMRDEIGDEAYDRYLTALGHPNRVQVDEVLSESPAAQVGLQAGDVVLRYGDVRIFAPQDLVSETRGGAAGERVRVEIIRSGQRLEVDVPRGPLGIRIAARQADPEGG